MAPTGQAGLHGPALEPLVRSPPGEEVVISGISGIFPSSDNTTEFLENLYKNVDLVTENDPGFHHPEAPRHLGQINGLNKFDAQFFRVTYHHATAMEPISRKLLEQAYTAIYDSGINPLALRGKKVGVFVGTSFSDTSNVAMYFSENQKGFVLSGCAKSMFSNRISYWIDAKGPSYSIDCSCASSMICLEHAYQAMVNGECEAAIVGAGNICKLPQMGLNLKKGNLASLDGKTKCFCKNGDGPVRAEAINCLFLQKAKDAKRIYAEVYYTQTTYGLKEDAHFLPIRKSKEIAQFLQKFYSNIDVSPSEVDYIEADGSAIAEADANELEAIAEIFTKEKLTPLKVGSVKSNMGHADSASGFCAVTKVCLAYHKGALPANLHYTEPVDVPELKEGKIQVLQENEDFNRGYTAINQFSYTGMNCHTLLKGHYKPKDISKYNINLPRLVLASGRKDECVKKIFNNLESHPFDPELIGMLHDIYQIDTPEHTSKGYTLVDKNEKYETVTLSQNISHFSGSKKPLCLVFSGMGSQWPGMAAELMKLPTFATIIQRCHKVLEPKGINLIRILTEPDKTIFDNIMNCFIGITAVQIGLTNVLKEIGLEADYIIGHSQGEMCCAYWDDCFTAEETIIAAYSRGLISLESTFIKGSMAAVGLGYKDVLPLCPPEIDVACHNSSESVTLSGPAEDIQKFTAELTQKGIFAREVKSADIAFHSRYIQHAGSEFLKRLKQIIKEPKIRSEKWISTSVPQDQWHEDRAKYCSAEYHTNNLLNPVLFEEASQLIPKNAVVVEVAPHGLLQAILKRSHPECTHVPITKRAHENPIKFFFEAIGKLYQEGFNFKIHAFYPKIEYPVATETRMISHFVDWEHSEDWSDIVSSTKHEITATSRELVMSVYDDEFKYLNGYIRDGNNVLAESALLFFVWETLAGFKGVSYKDMSVVFQDIHFYTEAIIIPEETLKFNLMINKGNDYFEVTKDEVLLASGFVAEVTKPKFETLQDENENSENSENNKTFWESDISLKSNDLYEHLHSKGFTCTGEFQSIKSTNFKRTTGLVKFTENWVALFDSLIQLNILARDDAGIAVPKVIKKLTVNPEEFKKEKSVTVDGVQCLNIKLYSTYNVTRCAGLEIKHIIFDKKPIKQQTPDVLNSLAFVPFKPKEEVNIKTALQMILQIVSDNVLDENITATEVIHDPISSISKILQEVSGYIPDVDVEIHTVEMKNVNIKILNSNFIIFLNMFNNGTNINEFLNKLNEHAFILTYEQSDLKVGYFDEISSINVEGKKLLLLRKKSIDNGVSKTYLPIQNDEKFAWVPIIKSELQKTKQVVLISEKNPYCGLIGFVKALRKDPLNKISLVVLNDYNTAFDEEKPLFKEQLQKNMAFNILQKGSWGCYHYLQSITSTKAQSMKLVNAIPGDIGGLKWVETPVISTTPKQLVQVCYAGPSARDSQKVVGMINDDLIDGLGYDFSGFDCNGERVMGLVSGGAIASKVQADPDLLWQVPSSWSLEDAATVPLPYIHACYCLVIRSQLKNGQSLFVNDGTDALGQAVISIALSLNCTVFTSVTDDQKKQFLLKLFPQLIERNIGKTQNGDFYLTIKEITKGDGCDFIVNSNSGYLREAAFELTAPFGVFIDTTEVDWNKNLPLGMKFVEGDRNYVAARMSNIFRADNFEERKKLQMVITEGIANGVVKPISRIVYTTGEVSRAFKLLTLNKQRGRVLFKIRNAEISAESLNVIPRLMYSADGTYVIVCDETALGIELANRLVDRGVRKIMLHLKSKTVPGFVHLKLASWMKLGTQIKISTNKLHEDKGCIQFLHEAGTLGCIHGIFIIQETTTDDNRWSQNILLNKYETNAKVVTKLDVLSRNNCPELSKFVVISRSSTNAADEFTSSIADKICQDRLQIGLPAVNLRIEHLDDMAENLEFRTEAQNITTLFNALETCVKQKQSSAISFNLKKQKYASCINKIIKCLNLESLDMESRLIVNDVITNDIHLEELKSIIKDSCSIEFTIEKLRRLSLSSLISLARKETKLNNKFDSKLGSFFTFVDKNEYMATNTMVSMDTVVNKDIEAYKLDENATHLLLIPGFEGHHRVFKGISERLKVRAVTFQLVPDDSSESIPDMAKNIVKLIKRSFVFKSKFYLLGYSFGVNVALEIAALLEKEGHEGIVYCLDSSPDALRVQLDAHIGKKTESQLQDDIIEHFFQVMSGKNGIELSNEIKEIDNWSDKVNACVNRLKGLVKSSNLYMQNIIENAYKRILLAKNYKPSLRLNSELVLLKGLPHPKSGNLAFDYGLSEYTKKPVRLINVPSTHETAPYDCRIPNIVNKFIDPELMEDPKICHTYYRR